MQKQICKLPKRFTNCELQMANLNPVLISNLTKIVNDTAQKSLGIIKNSSLAKSWWNNQLTEAYKEYRETRKTYIYRATPANHKMMKSSRKSIPRINRQCKKV